MKISVQTAMVLNLDKCIGCHTCSIPCKNVWTNRKGAEYMWFNNVESKPGIGYPQRWENQKRYKGGWEVSGGHAVLKAGGRAAKLSKIFHNPDMPLIEDYYEPWTYDYGKLVTSPVKRHQPSIRPVSQITGKSMNLRWGPNWEDDLAGVSETGLDDVNFKGLDAERFLSFTDVFLFYLPRLCEHCLNPACVASCPSGALYKRDEDGIVLIDQHRCRGWRYCVSGCPYKKVYFNWNTGRSEKCIFCYPRTEAALPTLCAQTCVGRIRYVGLVLYDADRIGQAASVKEVTDLYPAQLEILLDPEDRSVRREARSQGISDAVLDTARRSPVDALIRQWKLALPLHPEFRTLPMVWYVPPLSPAKKAVGAGERSSGKRIDTMRIPTAYLANLLAAGDERPVRRALQRLLALRRHMRSVRLGEDGDYRSLNEVGIRPETADAMYRLLALARYRDRFVVPTRQGAEAFGPAGQGTCGFESSIF